MFGVLAEVVVFALGLGYLRRKAEKDKLEYKLNWQMQLQEAKLAKEQQEMKARFFANVSHEFRTPLTVIQGMADQIQRDPRGQLNEKTKHIIKNCNELLRLVSQVLDLSKLDAGHLHPNLMQGDIISYLQNLVESFHSMAESKTITLRMETELEHLEMDYDAHLIRHIISNLLSNSLKFTPQNGEIVLRIGQQTTEDKDQLILQVEDNGQGIPDDQLPRIFERFYQSTSNGEVQGGTGIGLALVKEITDILNGHIYAKSEVGKGSTFTVLLPITCEAPIMNGQSGTVLKATPLQHRKKKQYTKTTKWKCSAHTPCRRPPRRNSIPDKLITISLSLRSSC